MNDEISTIIEKIEDLLKEEFKERIRNYVTADREKYPAERVRDKFDRLIQGERWQIRNW